MQTSSFSAATSSTGQGASSAQAEALKRRVQQHTLAAAEAIRRGVLSDAQRAFGHLHALLFDRMYLYVRRELRSSENREAKAEELVNEVFLDFWMQLGRFDPERGEALSLLYRIARNKAHKSWAKAIRQGHVEQKLEHQDGETSRLENFAEEDEGTHGGEAHVEAAQQENNRLLLLAQLRKEHPGHADLLDLRYQEDLNAMALSERLGIEPAAVRKRLEAARLALFNLGWRWVREHAPPGYEHLPSVTVRSPGELVRVLEQDCRVRELFLDAFGTVQVA